MFMNILLHPSRRVLGVLSLDYQSLEQIATRLHGNPKKIDQIPPLVYF
jgi:hypothetical protein